jgi:hypothetical protein
MSDGQNHETGCSCHEENGAQRRISFVEGEQARRQGRDEYAQPQVAV